MFNLGFGLVTSLLDCLAACVGFALGCLFLETCVHSRLVPLHADGDYAIQSITPMSTLFLFRTSRIDNGTSYISVTSSSITITNKGCGVGFFLNLLLTFFSRSIGSFHRPLFNVINHYPFHSVLHLNAVVCLALNFPRRKLLLTEAQAYCHEVTASQQIQNLIDKGCDKFDTGLHIQSGQ